jgi:RNA polymerase sigma-70 factor, ECF subfamily
VTGDLFFRSASHLGYPDVLRIVGPTHDRDDARLVGRLRDGDAAAFGELYARFADPLYRFLFRLAGGRESAMDLHQETWLSAAKHASRLTEDTDLAAWLFTIARNKHRSYRRWVALDWLRIERFGAEMAEDTSAPVNEARDELASIEVALMELPEGHREVLLLVGVEGLDAKQAAGVLGVQPEALRQRLSRARAALAAILERGGQDAHGMVQAKRGAG